MTRAQGARRVGRISRAKRGLASLERWKITQEKRFFPKLPHLSRRYPRHASNSAGFSQPIKTHMRFPTDTLPAVPFTLSAPSKMPCRSFSLPLSICTVGSKLAKQPGTICSLCYAAGGNYNFGNVQRALAARLSAFNSTDFVSVMIAKLKKEEKSGFFRWFDSGDVPNWKGLLKIVRIAIALPDVRFWLPTKEYALIQRYTEIVGPFPSNLTVRLSAYLIDGPAPWALASRLGVVTSTVTSDKATATCPAPTQGNQCRDCRACWKSASNVAYLLH